MSSRGNGNTYHNYGGMNVSFTVNRKEFLAAMTTCKNVVNPRISRQIPFLAGIKIQTIDDGIKIVATDLGTTVVIILPAQTSQPGQLVLPVKNLFGLLSKLTSENVEIQSDDRNGVIRCPGEQFRITVTGFNPDGFPNLDNNLAQRIQEGQTFTLPVQTIREMVDKVGYAVDKNEDGRPIFAGMLWKMNGVLEAIGCNVYRLARDVFYPQSLPDVDVIVPLKILSLAFKTFKKGKVAVTLGQLYKETDYQEIFLSDGTTTIMSRLIPGKYIDFERATHAEFSFCAKMSKAEFLTLLNRIKAMSGKYIPVVGLKIGNNINVSIDTNSGQYQEDIPAEYDGPNLPEMLFNGEYLNECFRVMPGENLVIQGNGKYDPIMVKPAEDPKDYLAMIWPVRQG